MHKLIEKNEAAKFLNVPKSTLDNWIRNKKIPFIKLSPRHIRFDLEELEVFIESRKVKPRR